MASLYLQADETGDRQNLVAASIAYGPYSKPYCWVLKNIGNKALDHRRVSRRFFNGQSIDATMVNANVRHITMRPQFTIRTLMIGTMIFASVCGGIVWNRQRIQRRQEAIVWLGDLAGPVSYCGPNRVYQIDLRRKRLDETSWSHVSMLREARRVWLDETNVTGTDLYRLLHFQNLELLSLIDADLTDAELPVLLRFPKLEQLYLTGTGITSDGIETISRVPRLVNLNISKTQVGDEAIPALIKMKRLQTLNVYSTGISADGLAQLRHAMPKCRVFPNPEANKAVNRSTHSRGN